jgi:tripartite-type tricarboxylate transporter receptor subunit TctC
MRHPLAALASALCFLAAVPAALAQQAPVPPLIKLIVPFASGSTTDVVARETAARLGTKLGTTVVVEIRGGGSTMIGAGAVANGPHDGSMLLMTTNSTVSAAATLQNTPFDINKDLIPIAMIGDGPMMVAASAKSGIKTPADLVAMARAKPDTVTYGTSGVGSLPHLSSELFADAAKVQLKHIPYKGGGAAVVDLAAGTIDIMFATQSTFAPHIQAGRVVAIGVTTPQPYSAFPGLPAMATAAPGFAGSVWIAVFAQSGIPAALAQRLNRELNEIAAGKEMSATLNHNGLPPVALSLDEIRTRMRDEYTNWKRVATDKKIVLD